jgi:ATP-binding cassette subfamily F protein 3
MIQANSVTKSFGEQLLLDEISFTLGRGEKIGLVGRNGAGKSTLFKMILGKENYDSGNIEVPTNYRISTLEQHIQFSEKTVLEECVKALSEEEKYDHYKAEKILFGLGFEQEDLQKDPMSFSGGYQIRINLTKSLLNAPNLLLLDEPTNYLDIVSLNWLKKFLKNFVGEIILITHDRDFMDSVATHTMGIVRQKIKKIKGNSYKFYEQIQLEDELFEQSRLNQEKKKKELSAFVERFKAKASKATQAQSRVKQLEKMEDMDKLEEQRVLGLKFQYEKCPGKNILNIEELSFSYSNKKEDYLLKDITLSIGQNDRIGIIGKNGKGKSTLLNLIAKELTPSVGEVNFHPSLKIGHFGQANIQRLDLNNTIIEEVYESNQDLGQTHIRQICGSMMFTGDLAQKKIKVLSGGERSRVLLAKILAHKTNLLLLDEPTNHLDMESIEILAKELQSYQGSMIMVTHNEMMLKAVANKLIVFKDGETKLFEGGYEEFLAKIGWEETPPDTNTKGSAGSSAHSKKQRAVLVRNKNQESKPFKLNVQKLESKIEQAELKLAELEQKLITASNDSDAKLIAEYSQEIASLNSQIEQNFEKLEIESHKLEQVESKWDLEIDKL